MFFRLFATLMALLFLAAAAVQLNDPDPLIWIVMYVLCAGLSLAGAWRPGLIPAPALWLWSVLLLGWSAWLSLRVLGQQHLLDSEEGREMLGLALCGIWSLVLARCSHSLPKPSDTP